MPLIYTAVAPALLPVSATPMRTPALDVAIRTRPHVQCVAIDPLDRAPDASLYRDVVIIRNGAVVLSACGLGTAAALGVSGQISYVEVTAAVLAICAVLLAVSRATIDLVREAEAEAADGESLDEVGCYVVEHEGAGREGGLVVCTPEPDEFCWYHGIEVRTLERHPTPERQPHTSLHLSPTKSVCPSLD